LYDVLDNHDIGYKVTFLLVTKIEQGKEQVELRRNKKKHVLKTFEKAFVTRNHKFKISEPQEQNNNFF
jgi:hypothetical protein